MVGLSGKGFVAMIFTQALMFVLPSIILAMISVVPSLWFIYDKIEKTKPKPKKKNKTYSKILGTIPESNKEYRIKIIRNKFLISF